jgi:hypothetical protein
VNDNHEGEQKKKIENKMRKKVCCTYTKRGREDIE